MVEGFGGEAAKPFNPLFLSEPVIASQR